MLAGGNARCGWAGSEEVGHHNATAIAGRLVYLGHARISARRQSGTFGMAERSLGAAGAFPPPPPSAEHCPLTTRAAVAAATNASSPIFPIFEL